MNTSELTFLFTFVDDFFQALFHTPFGKKLRHLWENKRDPKKKLTLSEVVTFNLLKERMNMAYSFTRGVHGLFRHYLYCICSYLLRNLFEKLNNDIVGEIQLSMT